ncbi:hypothetical protein B0H17DRAFT_346879 [Mycena rosella]|uniref:Uncharacterized protein n=1 Tax=Mycena rosella TaxID=1033263 RepID=A0AAD7G1M3_MYCRO|nr:hypothetical protein B0H17DRAFT_346879 [Mycena rosella]
MHAAMMVGLSSPTRSPSSRNGEDFTPLIRTETDHRTSNLKGRSPSVDSLKTNAEEARDSERQGRGYPKLLQWDCRNRLELSI